MSPDGADGRLEKICNLGHASYSSVLAPRPQDPDSNDGSLRIILLSITITDNAEVPLTINLPLFSTVLPSNSCFCPVGLSLLIHFQQVLWVLKLLLSPGLSS